MDCTKCTTKSCRKLLPCTDNSDQYINSYYESENIETIKTASALIDNGRAGKLNRLEEISEYCKLNGYRNIGVAYCYGMDKEAARFRDYLVKEGFAPIMVSCTVDGICESRVDKDKQKQVVSCNPLGQAYFMNESGAEFVILMGLCLGHDILFQRNIKADFTTFIVKDRVLAHNPILALNGGKFLEDTFLEQLPDNYNMIKANDLKERLKLEEYTKNTTIIDLRGEEEYLKDHIGNALNCKLKELPANYKWIIPNKDKEVVIYCNGGIQSVYAVMYLTLKGYKSVKSLSGGYSNYI